MHYFVSDLDHTLLRTDLTLSPRSIETWNRCAKEAAMGIATARSYTKTRELLTALRLTMPLILLDGAMIVDEGGTLLTLKALDKERGDAIVEIGLRYGIDPFIIAVQKESLQEHFLYPRRLNRHQKEVLKGYRNDPRMQFNPNNRTMEQNLKIVYFGEEAPLRALHDEIKRQLGDAVEAKLSPEKYGGGWFFTLLHPEGDKAHALREVAAHCNIDPDHMTVFGDSINDIGMFRLAGTAVAVANALDEVKNEADIVLPHTNDEDAVARYLDPFAR